MGADLPHTLYKKQRGGKPSETDVEDATRKMQEAYERKRKLREEESFTIKEIFEGKADLDKQEE